MTAVVERVLGTVGAVGGGVLLLAPRRALTALHVDPGLPLIVGATRVLGARHLAQGAALALLPRRLPSAVAVVDAVHAASMLALAADSSRYRRGATISAAVALVSGVITVRAARAAR